jgi:hypothetical protein
VIIRTQIAVIFNSIYVYIPVHGIKRTRRTVGLMP